MKQTTVGWGKGAATGSFSAGKTGKHARHATTIGKAFNGHDVCTYKWQSKKRWEKKRILVQFFGDKAMIRKTYCTVFASFRQF